MKASAQIRKATPAAAPRPRSLVAVHTPGLRERPDIATQLAGAALFGHHLSALNVQSQSPLIVQPKLTVGPVNDKYEQEADRIARQVVAMRAPVQRRDELDEDDEIQMKALVQRQDELDDDDDLQMKPHIQRQADLDEDDELQMEPLVQRFSAEGFESDGGFESRLNSRRGTGAPLPIALRAEFEPKFGADFGRVRIHTDAQSHQLNESIQAKAFTTGQDLFFRQGAFNPGSRSGQELLAHELTHVVQQSGEARTLQREYFDEGRPLGVPGLKEYKSILEPRENAYTYFRAVTEPEYEQLSTRGYMDVADSYQGISPTVAYASGYFGANQSHYLVEFTIVDEGINLRDEFRYSGTTEKAEQGVMSLGLGSKASPVAPGIERRGGEYVMYLLKAKSIRWRLVRYIGKKPPQVVRG